MKFWEDTKDLIFVICAGLVAIESFREGSLMPIGCFTLLLFSEAAYLLITNGLNIRLTVRNKR